MGRFVLGPLVGEGGMGRVYQAYDPSLHRIVALKLVRNQDPQLLARFEQEARAQARVDHPNICKVYEVGNLEGVPFIAMQYVEGGNLAQRRPGLGLADKVRIITLAAGALEAAHQAGLIHRDIKPSNIMLEDRAEGVTPFLMDFGLAREEAGSSLTVDEQVLGTPAYMAPEQALGATGRIDARADVYALGATFYFLLANRPPFREPNAAQTLVALSGTEVPDLLALVPDLPPDLAVIVHKCLEKEPDRRYASARLLAEDLERFSAGEPIQARPPSLFYLVGKKARKHKATTLVLALATLLGTTATVLTVRTNLRARAQAELARRFGEQVKDLEWSLRLAHLLPCHDLQRDQARVRQAMAAIRAEMAAQPGLADAPGAYALGRGHLVLGEYQEARRQLMRAWELGARGPQVAQALGYALGELYRRGLEEAEREPIGDARTAIRQELERNYRNPALDFIRLAGDEPYLKGLLAYYEGRDGDAARLAREALAADPALFEAHKLMGDAALDEAEQAFQQGLAQDAAEAADRAAQAFRTALTIARSQPGLYLAEARRCMLALRLSFQRNGAMDRARLDEALGRVDQALVCDPGASDTQLVLAQVWSTWAEELRHRGQSPMEANGKALEAGRKAALTDPGAGPLLVMANLQRSNAEYIRYHGGLPDPWIAEAADHFRRAAQLEPGNTAALRGHILLCFVAADTDRRRGRDPRAVVEEGLALGERLVKLQPGLASNHDWVGGLAGAEAEYLLDHGLDPGPWFQRANDAFEKALAINARDQALMNNLAYYTARRGQWDLESGRPAASTLARALDYARRGIVLDPKSTLGYGTFALAARAMAEAERRAGRNPMATLREGLAATQKGEAQDPRFYDNPLQAGLLGLVEAQWLASQHASPEAALTLALAKLEQARTLNLIPSWETELALARGQLLAAEYLPARAPALRAAARKLLAGVARMDPQLKPLKDLGSIN
ncbi:serine/threonine-protein kinase [Mesoterricola silvestris]|uniref:serine/threonine-protein kinase n=1 Tax=Mesoterricola silvestris TaxID=2927979 RepID=UPI002931A1A0|nr:serine/threonine-protein kinase [Mesoterricola silvestris]